jgi:hypothetical protein
MAKLSVPANRVIENMKLSGGYLSLSQARTNRDAVSELLDAAKIVFTNRDGVDCYKLLGFTPPQEKERSKPVDARRRFTLSDAGDIE